MVFWNTRKGVCRLKRITVFYGLYGGGKSEIAINYALKLRTQGHRVSLVDLDAVTPYFRVRDVRQVLVSRGVHVVSPKESVSHADLPVLPPGIRQVLSGSDSQVVVDVGGDPTGARVLGGLKDVWTKEASGMFVVNFNRPFTRTVEEAAKALEIVSNSAGLKASGIVSNTHLAESTRLCHVVDGLARAKELGLRIGLPVEFVGVSRQFLGEAEKLESFTQGTPILWLERFLLKPWEQES